MFLFLAFEFLSKAQTLNSPFITKTFTSQDGLPHSYIYSMLQDHNGYLWVGTRYGLGRFDGHNFSSINLNDIATNNVISWIYEDEKEKIWMYAGSGVYIFDGGRMSLYENNIRFPLTLVLKENENRPGEPWAVRGREMCRMDNYSGLKPVTVPDFGNKYCRRAAITKDGNYYNLMEDIFFVKKNGEKESIGRLIPSYNFILILGYWNNQLCFYTNNGIYTYADKKIKILFQKQLDGKHIYSAYKDAKNRFWVATEQSGILISKTQDENKFSYSIKPSNNLISGFYEDNEDNMWIAGFEGLIKVEEKNFETFSGKDYPYLSDLNLIAKDTARTIFSFSETKGFSSWCKGKFSFESNNALKGQLIDVLCRDDKNRFWCISRQNKLILFNHGKIDFINNLILKSPGDLKPNIVFDNYRKKIWVPGDELFLGDENGFRIYKDAYDSIVRKPDCILYLGNGKIIAATSVGELFLINSSNQIIKVKVPETLHPERIHHLFPDSSGNIWIAYPGTGLLQCSLENDSNLIIVNQFTRQNGLNNDVIQSMAFDKQNRIWISTMAGITVIDFMNKVENNFPVHLFGKDEGMPATGLEYGRLLCDDNGDMWYSTQYSLMKFRVNEMQFDNVPPPVSIEKVQLNMNETNWHKYSDSLSGIFQIPINPVMNYDENTITVIFKAATMDNAETLQYSYKLNGLNDNWSNNSTANAITFSKLSPGVYTFLVRARENNFNWSKPASFSFTIQSPYWQRWWFITLLLIAGAVIIYGLFRIRINQLNKEKKIRDQIASDLHDDLGSTLNSVKVYANVASLEKDNKQYLEKIKESTQAAITSVRDIIWVLDEKKDSIEHLFTRISQFALPLCSAKHIQFVQEIDNSLYNYVLEREEKRNLFMIIKEAINNSIKYADCKRISLSVAEEKNKLVILISDDGKGYNADTVHEGHGLKNIQRRSAEIHYSVKITSLNDIGTGIRLGKK